MRRPSRSGVSVRVGIAARGSAGRAGGWWLRSRPWSCRVSVPMARWMFRAFASDTPPVRPRALVGAGQHAMWLEEREAVVGLWCAPPSRRPPLSRYTQRSSVTLARSKVHRSRTRRSAPYVPVIPRSTTSIPLCRSLTSHGVCWAGLGCRAASLSLCIRDRNRRLWDRSRRLPLPFDVHRSWSSPALVARRLRPFYL